jgi:hypothetical protein
MYAGYGNTVYFIESGFDDIFDYYPENNYTLCELRVENSMVVDN